MSDKLGFGANARDLVVDNNYLENPDDYASAIDDATFWSTSRYKNQQEVLHNLQNQAYNSSEAQKARDFQLELSSTQYQRAVEDMQKAGLNPASLTAGGISSGSSSSGSSASSQNSHNPKDNSALKAFASIIVSVLKLVASAG